MKKGYVAGAILIAGVAAVAVWKGLADKEPANKKVAQVSDDKDQSFSMVSPTSDSWGSKGKGSAATATANKPVEAKKPDSLSRPEKVEHLVKVSGIAKRLTSMNSMIEQQLEALLSDQELNEKEKAEFAKIFKENFDGDALLADYKRRLSESLDDSEIEQLQDIYNDPNVARYHQLNNDMMNPLNMKDHQEEFMEYMNSKGQNPTAEERRSLIERLDEVTNTSAQTTRLSMEILKSFAQEEEGFEAGKEMDAEFQAEISKAISQQVRSGLEFTLRDTPDGEVSDLAKAMNHDSYRKANGLMTDTVTGPLKKIFTEANRLMGDKSDHGRDPLN